MNERPEFNTCANCGERIARLGDREKWHHFGGWKQCAGRRPGVARPSSENDSRQDEKGVTR